MKTFSRQKKGARMALGAGKKSAGSPTIGIEHPMCGKTAESATFEVRSVARDQKTQRASLPLVRVQVIWPIGEVEGPNPAAKAVLDAVGRVFSELALRTLTI